jgi:NADPH:quinone reductase-like Zn-dependent oxidoreductase
VDAVLALAGGAALDTCLDQLRPGGRVAFPSGVRPEPQARAGLSVARYDALTGPDKYAHLNEAIVAAKLQVPVAGQYTLADAAKAQQAMAAGHVLGKIVLRVR